METTSTSKRVLTWGIFVVILGLIVWGLIAAQQKASRQDSALILPTEVVETDRSRGSATAPATLVVYGDFQCPACANYHPLLERLIAEMGPDKLRFVFRHFPLPNHLNAFDASRAAEAAGEQGKFWEMYRLLYEQQSDWRDAKDPKAVFVNYAKEMGLDTERFSADFDSETAEEKISNDYKGGSKGGVNSTPTFFLNGKRIDNPQSYEAFKQLIDSTIPNISL